MQIATLKKRAEFDRIRGGGRWSTSTFVMEGKPRRSGGADLAAVGTLAGIVSGIVSGTVAGRPIEGPRFGFTISKKVGIAVVRNRIRRRLRAALIELSQSCAEPHYDYVVIARKPAFDRHFDLLKSDLEIAFRRVHEGPRRRSGPNPSQKDPSQKDPSHSRKQSKPE